MTTRPASDLQTWATTGDIVEPSSGQKADGYEAGDRPAAEHINFIVSNLALWAGYLDTEKLLDVLTGSSAIPLIATSEDAHDHPSSASNVWRLLGQFNLPGNPKMRVYAGDNVSGLGGGCWAITTNAVWDPASGSQTWSKDDTSQESTLLRGGRGQLNYYQRNSGAGTWTTAQWDDQNAGDVALGGNLAVAGGNITASAGNITASAGAIVATVGDVQAGNNLTAAVNVQAGTEYFYVVAKTRTSEVINIFDMVGGGGSFDGTTGDYVSVGSEAVRIPLKLPIGATITSIQLVVFEAAAAAITVDLRRSAGQNYVSPGATGAETTVSSDTSAGVGGREVLSLTGETIINAQYSLLISFPTNNDRLQGARSTWSDLGPRNHL